MDPLSPTFPFGAPAVGWRRVYKNGARAIGMAFSLDDQSAARRFFESAGYSVVAETPTLELRDGHARARFLALLWWQREDRAP